MSTTTHPRDVERTTARPDPSMLLAAARRGDEAAWSELISSYAGLIAYVTRSQGLSAADGADVAQTTWLRLLTHIDTIQSPHGLGSWLAITARRECTAHYRRRRHEQPIDDSRLEATAAFHPQEDVVERLDLARRCRQLRRAMAVLRPRERALVELLYAEDRPSYRHIAERLDMPIGAIGPVRQRALLRLRHHLVDGVADGWRAESDDGSGYRAASA